ncbi:hypothetical protein ACOSQ2_018006 [Xanthoceras sorbifolium]|uniref:Uncharacterized protein n=1 Tax=Xanthoceras sorbifolium TaxID=99658 RepID=A0ABQ8HZP2_9ROSI|nr:hypothetical protein JRO89_XS05G0006900 [Xanthoceras sorbifolium]
MEGEKRSKPADDREMHRKRRKGEEVDEGQTVTEDEVEEFFAILRRIQVSLKYFEKNKCDGRMLTENRWLPRFQADDFDKHNDVNADNNNDNGGKKDEDVVGDSGLDLNSDPASSNNSV